MKTKFSIGFLVFTSARTKDECVKIYKSDYKKWGWKINIDKEDVYVMVNREINLNEGDIVDVCDFQLAVMYKITNITKGYIHYELEEEKIKSKKRKK